MELARFVSLIIRIALFLALAGELKSCTLQLMNKAAYETEHGMISYSKFTHQLTRQ